MFLFVLLLGLVIGRYAGWMLSRTVLYPAKSSAAAFFMCVAWGGLIALLMRWAINAYHPGTFVKIIGFGAASYIAVPNFGLVAERSIPPDAVGRHQLISNLPLFAFIAFSIIAAFS